MKIPTILAILSALLMPLQIASAQSKDKKPSKKPTTSKTTKKKKPATKKSAPKKPATKATKAPAKKAPAAKKPAPKKKPAAKKLAAKKSGSHVAMASPELKKKAAAWVKALPSAKKSKFLALLNKGVAKDFETVPGVGPAKFANLKKGRPFKSIEDLANINGFGEKTFKGIIDHVKKMK